MAPLDSVSILRALQELREKHAWESVTKPQVGNRPTGEAYMYVVGFQSGLDEAQKLVKRLVTEAEKDFPDEQSKDNASVRFS